MEKETGEGGGGVCLTLHCHHQNDFCTEMGSDECHFNPFTAVMSFENDQQQCEI